MIFPHAVQQVAAAVEPRIGKAQRAGRGEGPGRAARREAIEALVGKVGKEQRASNGDKRAPAVFVHPRADV